MFIDNNFFIAGRTEVAGINTKSGDKPTPQAEKLQNDINGWIFDKEPMFLRAILGEELYCHLFDDRCDQEDYLQETPLREKIRCILVDDTLRRSPIAIYVYFFYERNRVSVTTVVGERMKKTTDSIAASPMFKLVSLWNDMVDWNYQIIHEFERQGIEAHPDFESEIFHKINRFNI